MAHSKEHKLEQAVLAVVEAAKDLTNGQATAVTVDLGGNAEYPFRVLVPDEQLPLIGQATPE